MTDSSRPVEFIRPVLVVEDDHELAEMLREVLTLENCAVDVAANGMEALERLPALSYDAIICDLMMPGLDGQALYEEVSRRYPSLAERFIFITGQPARRGGLTDFVHRSGNTLIEKPFEVEQVRAALRDLFARG